jgi:hypothetical protein
VADHETERARLIDFAQNRARIVGEQMPQ